MYKEIGDKKTESGMKQEERDAKTETGENNKNGTEEESEVLLNEPIVLKAPAAEEKPTADSLAAEAKEAREARELGTEDRKLKAGDRELRLESQPQELKREGEEKKPFGVAQFVKLLVFGGLLVVLAYFLGATMKFVFDQPFFFFSLGETWPRLALFGIALLVFMIGGGVSMVAFERSFLAFIPAWVLGSTGFFVGIGEYGTIGLVSGAGFALALAIFYMFVKGDLKDSFSFSVRSAFSSMGIFLTIVFLAVGVGYYLKVDSVLKSQELLPEEVMRPVYDIEKRVLALQLEVPEDEVEDKLREMEAEGDKVSFLGLFESDAELQAQELYDWMRAKVSDVAASVIPYAAGGLALVLFSILSFLTPLVTIVSRSVIFVVMEALVAIHVFSKKRVLREAEVLEI